MTSRMMFLTLFLVFIGVVAALIVEAKLK